MAFGKEIVGFSLDTKGFDQSMKKLELSVKDFSPVTKTIEKVFLATAKRRAWSASGLKSRTGELKGAVTSFSGKVSFGVGLRTKKGEDLVLAKAATHTFGRAKWSNKQDSKRIKVRGYDRRRGEERHAKYIYVKKRRSPFGDIPARPFMPQILPDREVRRIEEMLTDYIRKAMSNV